MPSSTPPILTSYIFAVFVFRFSSPARRNLLFFSFYRATLMHRDKIRSIDDLLILVFKINLLLIEFIIAKIKFKQCVVIYYLFFI